MSNQVLDVAIVGAGPAGLAVAIDAALRGLSVAVFERHSGPPDKACGEGVMPAGVRALEELGVRSRLPPGECRTFRSIRYVDAGGARAEGSLPREGLAVRRTALSQAMADRAREVGADLRFGCEIVSHRRTPSQVWLETAQGRAAARVLVAADGLASPLRRKEGLECERRGPPRFGLRRHFHCAPWSSSVEVYFGDGAEAYVTPVSDDCVGVAFLWSEPRGSVAGFPAETESGSPWWRLERKFPALMAHLERAAPRSRIRGAGPLARATKARIRDRFALVGDAAGYVDAITGEGISLSLLSAAALARILPNAIARGATQAALEPYEREFTRLFRSYAAVARTVLAIASRPRLRRSAVELLRRWPAVFDQLLLTVG